MTKVAMPQMHVGRGLPYGPSGVVTVFPVWSAATPIRGLATGAHAELEVGENPEGPVVEMLSIHNRGVQPALLLEGELFEGGWQTAHWSAMPSCRSAGPIPSRWRAWNSTDGAAGSVITDALTDPRRGCRCRCARTTVNAKRGCGATSSDTSRCDERRRRPWPITSRKRAMTRHDGSADQATRRAGRRADRYRWPAAGPGSVRLAGSSRCPSDADGGNRRLRGAFRQRW